MDIHQTINFGIMREFERRGIEFAHPKILNVAEWMDKGGGAEAARKPTESRTPVGAK